MAVGLPFVSLETFITFYSLETCCIFTNWNMISLDAFSLFVYFLGGRAVFPSNEELCVLHPLQYLETPRGITLSLPVEHMWMLQCRVCVGLTLICPDLIVNVWWY